MTTQSITATRRRGGIQVAMLAMAVVPMQIAYSVPPSGTVFNELAALLLWGILVALIASGGGVRPSFKTVEPTLPLLVLLGLLMTAAASSWWLKLMPPSLALGAIGLLAASALMLVSGASLREQSNRLQVLNAFFIAWVACGVITTLICVAQVFAPDGLDGDVIARSALAGRAIGNLRQPNQACSQLLWSAAAVLPLMHGRRLSRRSGIALFALMLFGIALTGSRTGMLGLLLLCAWGLLDRQLARSDRALLVTTPLLFGILWWLAIRLGHATGADLSGAARFAAADPSASRFGIWADTLSLIASQPWSGVGFGGFTFAWVLTPFSNRHHFWNNAHNLELQLAVELGIPLAALIVALLAWMLWRAALNAQIGLSDERIGANALLVMLAVIGVHSQLEYPLWYVYFLLPTAWLWGYCLGSPPDVALTSVPVVPRTAGAWRTNPLAWAGGATAVIALLAFHDYLRVAHIFTPPANTPGERSERIAAGERSMLFSYYADYAAAVTASVPGQPPAPLLRATHYWLDPQLMTVLIQALALHGDPERARYLAQRLGEFHNPDADAFLVACRAGKISPSNFLCDAPSRPLDWRDFK